MKSMNVLLDEAEKEWREEMSQNHPLHSRIKIVKNGKENGVGRDWSFSTDLEQIFATINNDGSLKNKFEKIIPQFWTGEPEDLARETIHYLLFHEFYHPYEAPFSREDSKKIHQSIRRGVLKAQPDLSASEQYAKVLCSQNAVKDFILDNRFFLDNQRENYVRQDIIPTWDVLELMSSDTKTNFYTITRFLYGVLYGPESTHSFFESKMRKDGVGLGEKALGSLIKSSVGLPKQKEAGLLKSLLGKAEKGKKVSAEEFQEYTEKIREVFGGEDRYAGIERFMEVLGPYVEKEMPQGRPDQGEGSGGSPQNILQDLLDDMSEEEQQSFIQELSQEINDGKLDDLCEDVKEDHITEWNATSEELNNLDLFVVHEFYKRNHPKITITGNKKVGQSVVVGKKPYWDLVKSTIITDTDLSKLNMSYIVRFQKKTRKPMLIPLDDGFYRLNEYELKEQEIKDVQYVDVSMDVPEIVELYLDSSGSMGTGCNNNSRWDMLSHVVYGFVDALRQGSKLTGKPCSVQVHNFADKQVSSKLVSVEDFWNGNLEVLKVMFKPENGYSVEDLNITPASDNKRRAYVVTTDGQLVLSGRTERESKKMKELSKNPNNNVLLFEIGGTYGLGNAVKGYAGLHYKPVHNKEEMITKGIEVLLSK